MKTIVLENEIIKVEFDGETGAVLSLLNKETGWNMNRRPELGLSFSMLVPMPDRRDNPVLGTKQKCGKAELSPDGKSAKFVWEKLESEHAAVLDIIFTGKVTIGDSGLTFEGSVENNSPYTVESVSYPCLGDVPMPSPEEPLRRLSSVFHTMESLPLLPEFTSDHGYWASDSLLNQTRTAISPYVLVDTGKQGLYAACHDETMQRLMFFQFTLKPGFRDAYANWTHKAPPGDEIGGLPVHLELESIHFPFFAPGEKGELTPIVLRPYVGSWHNAIDYFKTWKSSWYKAPDTPEWAKEVHSWQQYLINSSEDSLRISYKELVEVGKECAEHGVGAIQLTGWNNGGQDRGNPAHDTDPRLGTWQDLKESIEKIQKMGVRVVLFAKFTWSDRATDWFRNELHRYATKDPYGDCHYHRGYQFTTTTQLADINTRRFSPMCPLSREWRDICCKEFTKMVDLGADGMLYDECQHHGGILMCFDPTHGHHVPAYINGGDTLLGQAFRDTSNRLKPDFLFAGEEAYDLLHPYYDLSYFRMPREHVPVQRYIEPFRPMMCTVSGFDDRMTINMCLMYRYIISYEPYNFKGRLPDFPLTLEYGKKVDALRKRYSEYVWDAEFRDTLGAAVTVDGKPYAFYTVFGRPGSGKRAVVVTNDDDSKEITATIKLDGPVGKLSVATPEDQDARETNGTVTIPPRSVAVVMEG